MKEKIIISIFYLVGSLPIFIIHKLGYLIGLWVWAYNGRTRQITETNIELCFPHKTPEFKQQLIRNSLIQTAISALEICATWIKPQSHFINKIDTVEGEHLLVDAIKQDRGVLLLAPHLGNWEIVGNYITSHYDLTAMYKPHKMKALDQLIYKARSNERFKVVPTNNHGVIALLRALKAKEIVAILPDQEPDLSGGMFAPLYGVQALSPVIVSRLINKTNAVAIGVYCLRLPHGRYKVVFHNADPLIYSNNPNESVKGLNLSVEQFINEAPEQYQWEYKRFSKRPDNEPNPYKSLP